MIFETRNFRLLEKILTISLVFLIRAELYVAVHCIGPPQVLEQGFAKFDEEVVTALERRCRRGCSAGRGGGAVKLECRDVAMSAVERGRIRVAQTSSRRLGNRGAGVAACTI